MSIPQTDTNYDVYVALGYAPLISDSVITGFSGSTPSQDIIDAVEALPSTIPALWNVDTDTDTLATTLQGVVSGSQWSAFVSWHTTQWQLACKDVIDNQTLTGFLNCCSLFNGSGFSECKALAKDTLDTYGITRHPF